MKIDIPTIDFLSKDVEQQVWDAFTNYGMKISKLSHTIISKSVPNLLLNIF